MDENRPVYVMRLKPRSCLSNFRVDMWARGKDYPQVPTANLSAWQSDHRLTIFVMVGSFDSGYGTRIRALCHCIQIGIRGSRGRRELPSSRGGLDRLQRDGGTHVLGHLRLGWAAAAVSCPDRHYCNATWLSACLFGWARGCLGTAGSPAYVLTC